jgi:hypothetical protein
MGTVHIRVRINARPTTTQALSCRSTQPHGGDASSAASSTDANGQPDPTRKRRSRPSQGFGTAQAANRGVWMTDTLIPGWHPSGSIQQPNDTESQRLHVDRSCGRRRAHKMIYTINVRLYSQVNRWAARDSNPEPTD